MTNEGVEMKKLRRPAALAAAGAALLAAGTALGAGAYAVGASPATTTTVVRAAAAAAPAARTQSSALSVNEIYRRNAPGVVQVTVTEQSQASPYGFGSGSSQAQGSGFVYDTKGHIVTNEHVVDGATSIRVTFADGKSYTATVVGRDTSTDLAVLHVDAPASELHPLTLASSTGVQVGDGVVAIGSPFGLAGSVTTGIVSALHRS
ncbi:MAG TPA: trypsin-like peptidase domain-containing protein, partial [Gaiellaceae bacterium]